MSVKVAVRCRPFNKRELKAKPECIISMKDNSTFLAEGTSGGKPRQFTFDHSFWSFDEGDSHFADQSNVYASVGESLLDEAFRGYNACVFAYGQTGAGKSYSMMGGSDDGRGIIPRLCEALFERIDAKTDPGKWNAKVEVSYMEIYLEKVKDLLSADSKHTLRVRENAHTGPYVEGLSSHAVKDFGMIDMLMDEGSKMRTVKATAMNDVSSRSHAIFQLIFTQTEITIRGKKRISTERVSKISLVDLAGSERSGQINAADSERMKEGNVINQSLSTLGKVISTLADKGKGKKGTHVPYRESVLTWLLRESLGGNSKTLMLAAISPAAINYEETLSTLRYANQAKNIVNKAKVNEDATATMVRQLNEEIERLRAQLEHANVAGMSPSAMMEGTDGMSLEEVEAALEESESLMDELTRSWEDKLMKTMEMQEQRSMALRAHGILMDDGDAPVGILRPDHVPFLMNLNPGQSSRDCLVVFLRDGVNVVVQPGVSFEDEGDPLQLIELDGLSIAEEHCEFHSIMHNGKRVVSLNPLDADVIYVNNIPVVKAVGLKSGDIIQLSRDHIFKYDNPDEPAVPTSASTFMALSSVPSGSVSSYSAASTSNSPHMTFSSQAPTSTTDGLAAPTAIVPLGMASPMSSAGSLPGQPAMSEADIQRLEEARKQANYAYQPDDEDDILGAILTDFNAHQAEFKLLPAYGVYLMCRHWLQREQPERMSNVLDKVGTLMKMHVLNSKDPAELAVWLGNAGELFMALRSDAQLAMAGVPLPLHSLSEIASEAYHMLVEEIRARLLPALGSILTDVQHTPFEEVVSLQLPAKHKQATYSMKYLLDTLEALHRVCQGVSFPKPMMKQLFEATFAFVGAATFNLLIDDKTMFRCDRGLLVRFNVTTLSDWAAKRGVPAQRHCKHLIQAAQLLQAQKTSLQQLDVICEACKDLNSLQVERILKYYKPASDEGPMAPTLLDCVKARFLATIDEHVDDDESVAGKVQLHRNADFWLPFRLSGHSQLGLYLASPENIVVVKGYINAARRESVASASNTGSNSSLTVPGANGDDSDRSTSSPAKEANGDGLRSWFRRTRSPAILHVAQGRRRRAAFVSAAQWARLDIFESATGLEMGSDGLSFFDLPSI